MLYTQLRGQSKVVDCPIVVFSDDIILAEGEISEYECDSQMVSKAMGLSNGYIRWELNYPNSILVDFVQFTVKGKRLEGLYVEKRLQPNLEFTFFFRKDKKHGLCTIRKMVLSSIMKFGVRVNSYML